MDRVLHLYPALLEHVGQLSCGVLRLGDGKSVAGHDDHALRVGEQRAEVFRRRGPNVPSLPAAGDHGNPRPRLAERAEEDVGQRAAHRVAHQLGQERT